MKNKAASILLRVLGMLMIMVVIATCCPVAIPRLAGYEVYNIVSGSMEPAIGVGSVVYVKPCRPHDMEAGDIPAFYVNGDVIVHRIVRNDIDEKVLFTKGDANAAEDMNPIPYNMVIGRVERVIPQLGNLIVLYTSRQGKVCVLGFLLAGMLLLWLSGHMSPGRRERIENERLLQEALIREGLITPKEAVQKETVQKEAVKKDVAKKEVVQKEAVQKEADDGRLARRYRLFMAAAAVLLVSLVAVIVLIGKILYRYYDENDTYAEASAAYVQVVADTPPVVDTDADTASVVDTDTENSSSSPKEGGVCPIRVDFDSLQALNEDIIAWIYCEGTVIDYPVCKCDDDQFYLEHAYDKSPSHSGAIFLEVENSPDFSDTNNILYGHHMKNKTMFATLAYWADQGYFEQHPYMWLLTPEQSYRIDLFAGYLTSALSDVYTVSQGYGTQLEEYLEKAADSSDFTSDVVIPEEGYSYIVLSTCEYQFDNARYVLHGKLVPADFP